jgi:hypothetical protein
MVWPSFLQSVLDRRFLSRPWLSEVNSLRVAVEIKFR